MGGQPVPSYANIVMADIDQIIKWLAAKYNTSENEVLRLFKRFLDDYFMLFTGSKSKFHKFLEEINQINPAIKLTMCHTTFKN